MKKLLASLLIITILGCVFSTGMAQDYQGQVLTYLAAQIEVAEDEIMLNGSLVELPLTGEQFWVGKYYLELDGSPAVPLPEDVVRELPQPDIAVAYDLDVGVVYLRVKTGEFLTPEEAQRYFDAEHELLNQELERLSKEAGKISVYFYQQLIKVSPDETFDVVIWPEFIETAAIRRAIEQVYEEYSDLNHGRVPSVPGMTEPGVIDGGGSDGSTGSVDLLPLPSKDDAGQIEPGYGETPPGDYRILPAPDERVESYPADRWDNDSSPDGVDDAYWARYEEMQQKLTEILMQGYQDSLTKLKGDLDSMGVVYEELEGTAALRSEMTGNQILSLKEKEYINSISEFGNDFFVMEDSALRTAAAPDISLQGFDKDGSKGKGKISPYLLIPALFLLGGAGYMFALRKKTKPAQD